MTKKKKIWSLYGVYMGIYDKKKNRKKKSMATRTRKSVIAKKKNNISATF
jgi:hypothetical protein